LNQSSTEPPIREASSSSSRRSREDRSDHPMRLLLAWGNSANRGTSGVVSMFVCPNENNSQKLENKR